MTSFKALIQPKSVTTAVHPLVAVVACFVLFAVTETPVSLAFADSRERDGKEHALAVNPGDTSERTGEGGSPGAARLAPSRCMQANLRDLPDLDPTTGRPAAAPARHIAPTMRPRRLTVAQPRSCVIAERQHGWPLTPAKPKIGDTRPAPAQPKAPEISESSRLAGADAVGPPKTEGRSADFQF